MQAWEFPAQILKFQHIMNCAAQMNSGIGKCDHISLAYTGFLLRPEHSKRSFVWPIRLKMALCPSICLTWSFHITCQDHYIHLIKVFLSQMCVHCIQKYRGQAFAYAGPLLFNSLPSEITLAPFFNTFKSKLKTYLFRAAYGT